VPGSRDPTLGAPPARRLRVLPSTLPEHAAAEPEAPEESPAPARRLEALLMIYVRDPLLHPVLLVALFHAAALLVPAVLGGLRDRTGGAMGALFLFVAGTGLLVRDDARGGGPGPVSLLLGGIWLAAAGLSWIAHFYGLF